MHHDARVEAFYTRKIWRKCRAAYLTEKSGLCELCLAKGLIVPAVEVHHKTPITPETVDDPDITLNHANLMALCEACHHEQHTHRRWRCDPETGAVRI